MSEEMNDAEGCTLVGVLNPGHGDCRKMLSLRLLLQFLLCLSVYIRIVMPDIISIHVFGVPPLSAGIVHMLKNCLNATLYSNDDTLSYIVEETKAFYTG